MRNNFRVSESLRRERARRILLAAAFDAPRHGYFPVCVRRALDGRGSLTGEVVPGGGGGVKVRIALREYQRPVFEDRSSGILILHWARQIGKSFTLAAWAVDRLLTRPGRLVTVLSNSRENGAEFVAKCAEVCRLNGTRFEVADKSKGVQFQNMRMEVRIRTRGISGRAQTGRIKVLAANPRTARGFSGDLILDEFAFHEDSNSIWEAAEPILASNRDFLCRIASTGNGKHNLFYRMVSRTTGVVEYGTKTFNAEHSTFNIERTEEAVQSPESKVQSFSEDESREETDVSGGTPDTAPETGAVPGDGALGERRPTTEDPPSPGSFGAASEAMPSNHMFVSSVGYRVSRVSRTEAYGMGVRIYDPNTRESITPLEAREQALDKAAYDQNYECAFANENLTLLSHELINAAERDGVGIICEQEWPQWFLQGVQSPKSKVQSWGPVLK